MPGKIFITIPSNLHLPFRVGSLLILMKYKIYVILGMCRFITKTVRHSIVALIIHNIMHIYQIGKQLIELSIFSLQSMSENPLVYIKRNVFLKVGVLRRMPFFCKGNLKGYWDLPVI